MRSIVFLLLITSGFTAISQSKKEQIAQLNSTVDSLNQVIDELSASLEAQNKTSEMLEKQLLKLENNEELLSIETERLEKELEIANNEIVMLNDSIRIRDERFDSLYSEFWQKKRYLEDYRDYLLIKCNVITATFMGIEWGDLFHLLFEDLNGRRWDFGDGNNYLEDLPLLILDPDSPYGIIENTELIGKRFRIYYMELPSKTFNAYHEVIDVMANSIVKIELID